MGTLRSWDFGDARGFRSRAHRIHSSGDYRNPPPADEHVKLHEHSVTRYVGPRIEIPNHLRSRIGAAFVRKLMEQGCRVLAGSVGKRHAHFLTELPDDYREERLIIGKAKMISSYIVRNEIPGRIWAAGGRFKLITNRKQHIATFKYISKRQEKDAWVWTYRAPLPDDE